MPASHTAGCAATPDDAGSSDSATITEPRTARALQSRVPSVRAAEHAFSWLTHWASKAPQPIPASASPATGSALSLLSGNNQKTWAFVHNGLGSGGAASCSTFSPCSWAGSFFLGLPLSGGVRKNALRYQCQQRGKCRWQHPVQSGNKAL